MTVAGQPMRSELLIRAGDLVRFARRQGYTVDELVEIIERA